MKRVLIGTQLDVRDWFCSQKNETKKNIIVQNTGISYFSLLPDGFAIFLFFLIFRNYSRNSQFSSHFGSCLSNL